MGLRHQERVTGRIFVEDAPRCAELLASGCRIADEKSRLPRMRLAVISVLKSLAVSTAIEANFVAPAIS